MLWGMKYFWILLPLTFISTTSYAADEGVLFPDVTPATTSEFGYSQSLQEELLVRLEGVGFTVLDTTVVGSSVAELMFLCGEQPRCPDDALRRVPSRIALVVRVGRQDQDFAVEAAVHVRGVTEAHSGRLFQGNEDAISVTAQQVADFVDEVTKELGPADRGLASMARQIVDAASIGEQVWIEADVQPCTGVFTVDQMLGILEDAEDFLRYSDRNGAFRAARQLQEGLLCFQELLPKTMSQQVYARIFRSIGAGLLMGGQEQQASPWFVGAVHLDPQFEYGLEDMADGHPVWTTFRLLKEVQESEPSPMQGSQFGPGVHYMNGQVLERPEAREGHIHIYQRELEGAIRTWVIEGPRFPAEVVEPIALAEEVKKKRKKNRKVATEKDMQSMAGVTMVEPKEKPKPVARMELRGGVGAGAIDRTADVRVSAAEGEGGEWYQETPSQAVRPRVEVYAGVAPIPNVEIGLLVGSQIAQHSVQANSTDSLGLSGTVSGEDRRTTAHWFVQPRGRLMFANGSFRPYLVAGMEFRFFGSTSLRDESVMTFPTAPGGMLLGGTGGLGAVIKLSEKFGLSAEGTWTGHWGLRSGPAQSGSVPLGKPNPLPSMRQTIGVTAGVQIEL